MAHEDLIKWVDKQPDWARDALRRHAQTSSFDLDPVEKAAVEKRVRVAAGIAADEACDHAAFANEHLKGADLTGSPTLLCSLGPISHLARLASDQTLSFAIDGITLIYGDNGTGKSGYCRVAKKVCRSLTSEELLGNVFDAGKKLPAEVTIRYLCEGDAKPRELKWQDGTLPPPEIGNISVFDSRNARLYVDDENKIGFLPAEVALLERHAAHRGEMDATFRAELKALNTRLRVPLPTGYASDGPISKLFARMQPKATLPTEAEIRDAAHWTQKDDEELAALENALAEDPKVLAARCHRIVSVLSSYLSDLKVVDDQLSVASASGLAALAGLAQATAAAASLAATDRFKDEPLPGAGQAPWRLMYDYAQKYVQTISSELKALPSAVGDLCALCQQTLEPDASARLQRFAAFVADQASKAADDAQVALKSAIEALESFSIPAAKDVEKLLDEYSLLNETSKSHSVSIIAFFGSARKRQTDLAAAAKKNAFDKVTELPASLVSTVASEIQSFEAREAEFEAAAKLDGAPRLIERARLNELKDRKKLSQDLETVVSRLVDLGMAEKLNKCCALVGTQQVSQQITSLRRKMVTTDLENRIMGEIGEFDLSHVPFAVTDRSVDGESYFNVGLSTPIAIENDKVLSEGEQRALALACFLGELGADSSKHGIVIDDPVSSLDHVRIRRVAKRLVAEAAKGKQLIIFTHNLLFFNEVAEAAGRANPQVKVAKRIVTKSQAAGFGIISETDEPWIAQKVLTRIERLRARLKQLEKFTDFDTDEYRRAAKDFYTDLRETWERLVEELLLGKVVERFNTDVRTQSLKRVLVDDNDYKTVFWAMKRVSEQSGHDMAAARGAPIPKPDDMKADIKEIDDYRLVIGKRSKAIEELREQFEEPPKATVI